MIYYRYITQGGLAMNTGRIILDLPPTEDNNRNSEGAFIHLRDGKRLFG